MNDYQLVGEALAEKKTHILRSVHHLTWSLHFDIDTKIGILALLYFNLFGSQVSIAATP